MENFNEKINMGGGDTSGYKKQREEVLNLDHKEELRRNIKDLMEELKETSNQGDKGQIRTQIYQLEALLDQLLKNDK